MMKCCCLIFFIFCTILSNGGIISGICIGTCGTKGIPCKETFGSDWTSNGKCCDDRPCCKFLKAPCVPEICPNGFTLLSDQTSSANCYSNFGHDMNWPWVIALDDCSTTAGAYMWRPNTEQEANAVKNEFKIPYGKPIWTGANDRDKDGKYTFAVENSPFSFHQRPFGADGFSSNANSKCVMIQFAWGTWWWRNQDCLLTRGYICEYSRRVCP
ncbi:uncharacterized protein [Mytilus edulis]|uniref:uncharacterized protein n=1 Tax=Mytilus edulis TaxID=6550 RepID=UPI0039EEEDFA